MQIMTSRIFYVALLATSFLCSCTVENNIDVSRSFPPASNKGTFNGVNKTLMLKLVNEARARGCQCGDTYYPPAPPLLWDDRLETAALSHSSDMYKNNYFSHTESDGSNAGVRIQKAGYNWAAYGENIGMGYKTEKEVLEGWIKSPGHCKNLMNKMYKEMGVARSGDYWTQDFGTR